MNKQAKLNNVSTNSKANKDFMILSALGILFVVDSHLGNGMLLFGNIFPYNSFYMPMFMFISGYFFNPRHIDDWKSIYHYSTSKFIKHILPYLGWIVFYGILTFLLRCLNITEIGSISFIDLVHNILTAGTSFGFNDPSWFVPLLFCVTIFYAVIRKLFSQKWNDGWAMLFFALIGAVSVYLSTTNFRTNNTYMILKIPCFLQFYHLAIVFRKYVENSFDRCNNFIICLLASICNILLIKKYGLDISIPMFASMNGFSANNYFLPLIAAITGIAFWLKISKMLTPILGNNSLVNFISNNTAFIMTHHVAAKHLFIGILIFLSQKGLSLFNDIDINLFRTDPWYVYGSPWILRLSFFFTITILIISCQAWNLLIKKLRK